MLLITFEYLVEALCEMGDVLEKIGTKTEG